ncbi:MAG TPA: hypothetical protein VJY54_10940 [Lachnospiraceae bacterium]|nr:hypothetical protein [Lachnospiraceae bacterium]
MYVARHRLKKPEVIIWSVMNIETEEDIAEIGIINISEDIPISHYDFGSNLVY